MGVLRQIREVWCIPNLIFVVSNTQSIFSFTFFVCAPTHNAEALFYVSHSCSECLKMSNTCFLWPVFSKLGWGIRKLRTCYEILCVGKMIGIEADETPNGVSWRELLGGLSVSIAQRDSITLSITVCCQVISYQENIFIFWGYSVQSIFSLLHWKALLLAKVVVLYFLWFILKIYYGPFHWKTCGDCVYKLIHVFFAYSF